MTTSALLTMRALTSLQVGDGAGLGAITLPIRRERTTRYPVVAGSSVRGALRAQAADSAEQDDATTVFLFGPPRGRATDHAAGTLRVGDAILLALAVASARGGYALATCPLILLRWQRLLARAGHGPLGRVPTVEPGHGLVAEGSPLAIAADGGQVVVLRDGAYLVASPDEEPGPTLFERVLRYLPVLDESDAKRLVVLADDDFEHLARTAPPVETHIRLELETKNVAKGALFTEEVLPPETLLGCLIEDRTVRHGPAARRPSAAVEDLLGRLGLVDGRAVLHLGGGHTVGRGYVEVACCR